METRNAPSRLLIVSVNRVNSPNTMRMVEWLIPGTMADMATTMPTTNITTIPAASCPRITSSLPPVKYIMSMEPIITNPIARAAQFALVQALSLGFVI